MTVILFKNWRSKKLVTTSPDWAPEEAVELTKAIKEIPLDLLPIMDKDGYI